MDADTKIRTEPHPVSAPFLTGQLFWTICVPAGARIPHDLVEVSATDQVERRKMKCLITIALFITICAASVPASDWPQWQGPERNAISKEKGLLHTWPESGPPLTWKIKGLGGGDSSPAVAGGMLFGMSNRDGKEIVWAISETDGKEVWVTPLGDAVQQGVPQSKEGPACTPAVDGDRLFVIGMGGKVASLSIAGGKVLWQRSLTQDFGGTLPMWSYRESPLIDGDKLVCTPGGPDAAVVALNKLTGETIWQCRLTSSTEPPSNNRPGRPETPNRPNQPAVPDPATAIAGTKDSGLYQSEHWGMTAFSQKIPNGKYSVKLHFAETYQGITKAGQRVFSFNVQGTEFKDFDVWEKAGGFRRAYIETVPVDVTTGELRITFTRQLESPAIKAIEIVPQADDAKGTKTIRIKAGQSTPFTDSSGQVWQAEQGFEGGQMSAGTAQAGGRPGGRPGGFGGPRSGAAYSSAIVIDFEGQRQYVQLTANSLIGVAAEDGKLLWRYDRPANRMGINCSTPIFQNGLLFASSAYGNGGGAIKLVKSAKGEFAAEEVYFTSNMQNHHGGMIVHDGCLYGANGGNEGGFLSCMDFQTGKILWRDRNAPKGALLMADGQLYLRSEAGAMLLIEPSREGLVERGRFEQPDRTNVPAWAHPVIANKRLYIRDQDLLLCYDVTAK